MSERNADRNDTLSRRRLLRRGTVLATAGAVGIPAFTGTVAATNACPRSPEYWTEHIGDAIDGAITIPSAGELTIYEIRDAFDGAITIPPAGKLSFDELQSILGKPAPGDTVTVVARHYVATYLNLLRRPKTDPACANRGVYIGGLGTVEWEALKDSARRWLRLNDWDGTADTRHRDWTPSVEVEGIPRIANGEMLKEALEAFNNARFSELDCNCEESETASASAVDVLDTGQRRTDQARNGPQSPARSGHASIDGDGCTGGVPRSGHPWCRLL